MNTLARRALFWTPRSLCMLFALFLSLFALDVFGEGHGFWGTILALLIHLIPVYLVVIVTIVAWRREQVGAVLFIGLAALYLLIARGRFHWSAYAAISGPLLAVGVLFLLNWRYRDQLREPSPDEGGES